MDSRRSRAASFGLLVGLAISCGCFAGSSQIEALTAQLSSSEIEEALRFGKAKAHEEGGVEVSYVIPSREPSTYPVYLDTPWTMIAREARDAERRGIGVSRPTVRAIMDQGLLTIRWAALAQGQEDTAIRIRQGERIVFDDTLRTHRDRFGFLTVRASVPIEPLLRAVAASTSMTIELRRTIAHGEPQVHRFDLTLEALK